MMPLVTVHVVEVLRQGVWASLTGGWYYEPHQTLFCNTVHLYLWLFLLLLPLLLHLCFGFTPGVICAYAIITLVVFATVKFIVWYMHHIFDTCECVEEETEPSNQPHASQSRDPETIELPTLTIRRSDDADVPTGCIMYNEDAFASGRPASLTTFRPVHTASLEENRSHTQPALLTGHATRSDQGSVSSGGADEVRSEQTSPRKVGLPMEGLQHQSTIDFKADVHHHSSSGSSTTSVTKSLLPQNSAPDGKAVLHPCKSDSRIIEDPMYMAPNGFNLHRRRGSLDLRRNFASVRRARSSTDSGEPGFIDNSKSPPDLSEETLHECRKQTRKSFPGQSGSVDVFLNSVLSSKQDQLMDSERFEHYEMQQPVIVSADVSVHAEPPTSCFTDPGLGDEVLQISKELVPTAELRAGSLDRDTDSKYSTLRSNTSKRTPSYYTASESGGSTPTLTESSPGSGPQNSSGRVSSESVAAASIIQTQRRSSLIRNLRKKLQTLRSESNLLPEERSSASGSPSPQDAPLSAHTPSTPDLSWLFRRTGEDYGVSPASARSHSSTVSGDGSELATEHATATSANAESEKSATWKPRGRLNATSESDFKEDLRKLLEEIVASHPDAPDVLESVRQSIVNRRSEEEASTSALMPIDDMPSTSREEPQRRTARQRRPASSATTWRRRRSSPPQPLMSLANMSKQVGSHVAASHNDTSFGAVHCFQDEDGTWWTYTFDAEGNGTAQSLGSQQAVMELLASGRESGRKQRGFKTARSFDLPDHDSSSSEEEFYGPAQVLHPTSHAMLEYARAGNVTFTTVRRPYVASSRRQTSGSSAGAASLTRNPLQMMMERTLAAAHSATAANMAATPGDNSTVTAPFSASMRTSSLGSSTSLSRIRFPGFFVPDVDVASSKRHYYKVPLKLLPKKQSVFKLWFDRLQLLALFDRNRRKYSAACDVFLAVLVSVFAAFMLSKGFYHDFCTFLLCAITAGAQFSLLRSVQPDAASPIHGFNWLVSYSRPIYFCICAFVILCLNSASFVPNWNSVTLYGVRLYTPAGVTAVRDALLLFVLFLPLIFTLGLLPQCSTFLVHCCEQTDILFFGGTASVSVLSAIFGLCRSIICTLLLMLFAELPFRQEKPTEHVAFAVYCALVVVVSFLLSRSTSAVGMLWKWLRECCPMRGFGGTSKAFELTAGDPLPLKLSETLTLRFKTDLLTVIVIGILFFAIHCSTMFTALQPTLLHLLYLILILTSAVTHYLWPQLRKHNPWLFVAKPILRPHEFDSFEVVHEARIAWFERVYTTITFVEKNLLYPMLVLCLLTQWTPALLNKDKFGHWWGSLLASMMGMKLLRASYCNPAQLFVPLLGTVLLFQVDLERLQDLLGAQWTKENFLVDFYVLSIIMPKLAEALLKLQFVFSYIAPWQISWGSAFHAFAQPFGIPHSGLLIAQAFLSSLLSAPLNPFLGSALFVTSYMRPIKFWEKDYNTKRVDNSHIRLINQIDRGPTTDDNNLNSIFYEHLTRSLQHMLAGDVALGRWACSVAQGDYFILASYYLNCLVHIIEVGNGFVTFQLRGLEFRGTYCQQREVEAITEDVIDNSCCCCEPGHIAGLLSFNAAWNLRWLTWEVMVSKYVLEGYSITDNSAGSMLQVYELRKLLVTLYVKCIIYYAVRSPKLEEWMCAELVNAMLEPILNEPKHVDVDATFNLQIDEDYDARLSGVSLSSFANTYSEWVAFCADRRERSLLGTAAGDRKSPLMGLCYALSLVGRRALGVASHHRHSSVESFLYGLHALFKGDFRITSTRDEWVFADMDLLRCVVAPAVRMALKLHQDHFTSPDEYDSSVSLYDAITAYESNMFISHEGDPAWRNAVLANTPSLLALRHVLDDGSDEYKIIMLNRRCLNFRVIKLNRESVRGLWAGQQQELIFLRNRNPERGSIQNARQVLRNMINSSADQPIGYPIYVSPLTTSFVESHTQLANVVGPPVTFATVKQWGIAWLRRMRCQMTCSSNVSLPPTTGGAAMADTVLPLSTVCAGSSLTAPAAVVLSEATVSGQPLRLVQRSFTHPLRRNGRMAPLLSRASIQETSAQHRGEHLRPTVVSTLSKTGTPKVVLGPPLGSIGESTGKDAAQRVRILDKNKVFMKLNEIRGHGRTLVLWPDEVSRTKGGIVFWKEQNWEPCDGMVGQVVHRWSPNHQKATFRSHIDQAIVLVLIEQCYVPILESGVEYLGDAV